MSDSRSEMQRPADELLGLCLDLRAWAEVHGAEHARLHTEQAQPLPAIPQPIAAPTHQDGPALLRLAEEVHNCRRCGLHQSRVKPVFGVGKEDAEIVFVGESPGHDEDLSGQILRGEAGFLFDRIIESVLGLTRSDVYLCNLVKCCPPEDRSPAPDEVASCGSFLWQQLSLLRPAVIVALGQVAARALLQSEEDLDHLRGTVHPCSNAVLLATYHPSDLLGGHGDKRKVFDDMKLLRRTYQQLTGRELPTPPSSGGQR